VTDACGNFTTCTQIISLVDPGPIIPPSTELSAESLSPAIGLDGARLFIHPNRVIGFSYTTLNSIFNTGRSISMTNYLRNTYRGVPVSGFSTELYVLQYISKTKVRPYVGFGGSYGKLSGLNVRQNDAGHVTIIPYNFNTTEIWTGFATGGFSYQINKNLMYDFELRLNYQFNNEVPNASPLWLGVGSGFYWIFRE
jgi:hypothetical protein